MHLLQVHGIGMQITVPSFARPSHSVFLSPCPILHVISSLFWFTTIVPVLSTHVRYSFPLTSSIPLIGLPFPAADNPSNDLMSCKTITNTAVSGSYRYFARVSNPSNSGRARTSSLSVAQPHRSPLLLRMRWRYTHLGQGRESAVTCSYPYTGCRRLWRGMPMSQTSLPLCFLPQ
jgi:hypothetical protein